MITRVGDEDFSVGPTDELVVLAAPLTAPRTWTLPSGSVFVPDRLQIMDGSGLLDTTNKITIAAAAGETINGAAEYDFTAPYGTVILARVAPNAWIATSASQVGQQLAAQEALIPGLIVRQLDFAFDTPDIDTGAALALPDAGETIISVSGAITEAFDSGTSDALDLGITGEVDKFVAAQDGQVEANLTIEAGVVGYVFDGIKEILATLTSVGDPATAGAGVLTIVTVKTGG